MLWKTQTTLLLTGFAFLAVAARAEATVESETTGGESAIDAGQAAFFETHIRPALIEHCYECHSEEHDKRKGGLWLDRRSGWQVGGDSGPAIVPGNPDESLLLASIRYHDPDLEMPPKEKLPDSVIERFETWIRMGAPDPRSGETKRPGKEIDLEAGREFWSFRPITDPDAPAVADTDWARSDIDRFLLARLEAENLSPAPDTDKATLLRRITITLTGLPPTVAEQDAFLTDSSPEAFSKVVDRLLASDAFAERWGRHWLDITRYADTSGGGRAMTLGDAWRFRDYVIDSFRKDKPLDQLIREHIAGDLLPAESEEQRMEQVIGTGYLVLGPHNYENQDKELLELEIADEQIDSIGRSFLGMTIGCARCHDHKFDPIPTRDYYALAGIFTSTLSVRHANVSKWFTQPLSPTPEQAAAIARYEREAQPLKEKIDAMRREIRRLDVLAGGNPDGNLALENLDGIVVDEEEADFVGEWMHSTSNRRWVGKGYHHDLTEGKGEKSVTYRFEIPEPGKFEVRLAWSTGSNRATNVPVRIHHGDSETVVTANQQATPNVDGAFHSLGEFSFPKGPAQVVIETGGTNGVVIADALQLLRTDRKPETNLAEASRKKEADRADELRVELKELQDELKDLEKSKPNLPTVMAVDDSDEPADTPVRIRGLVRNFGETVPRGFLQVAQPADAPAPEIGSDRSGRLELAEWVTSSENPLTARVIANRIWLHLFGEGIVPSVDNFGTTGEPPSHPELLDHLATRLIAHDWSVREMIREIVLSRAWSMSSDPGDGRAAEVDPENVLLSHFPRRKIDAETLRDSLLAISGNLDSEKGGPALPKGFKSEFGYTFTSLKRSVYIPSFRNQPHEIFAAFDFANPNFVVGKRASSTIPTQSLYLMNSPFVHQQAEAAAERLIEEAPEATPAEKIGLVYRRVLGREPTETERRLSSEFISSDADWSALMRTLFACVDFQYVR